MSTASKGKTQQVIRSARSTWDSQTENAVPRLKEAKDSMLPGFDARTALPIKKNGNNAHHHGRGEPPRRKKGQKATLSRKGELRDPVIFAAQVAACTQMATL
jgi:hypothetical protein